MFYGALPISFDYMWKKFTFSLEYVQNMCWNWLIFLRLSVLISSLCILID